MFITVTRMYQQSTVLYSSYESCPFESRVIPIIIVQMLQIFLVIM